MKPSSAELTMDSPVGPLRLVARDGALREVRFLGHHPATAAVTLSRPACDEHALLAQARRELGEYFAGDRRQFEVPLSPIGTGFQRRVWGELGRLVWGETVSYRQIAERFGEPRAIRAVGRANATNPLAILVPCHRVLGADGSLTGYAGGLDRKRWLLELEGALPAALFA